MNHHPVYIKHDEGFTAIAPPHTTSALTRKKMMDCLFIPLIFLFSHCPFPLSPLPHLFHDEQDNLVKRDMAKFCISHWLLTTLRHYELKR